MKNRRALAIAIAVLAGLGLWAVIQFVLGNAAFTLVGRASPTRRPADEIISASAIRVEDLPQGWRSGHVRVDNLPGAEGRYITFLGTNDPSQTWVNVGEMLYVFESVEAAKQGYVEQSTEYFPPAAADNWKHVPELDFSHHADEMKAACLPGYINEEHFFACRAVGHYQNMVVVMLGNVFENHWLKMSDFRAVLEAMDRRIVAGMK